MRAPAIADSEIHRLRAPEQLGIGLLISSRELVDRAGITAERKEAPFLRAVIVKRNAGIVLDDGGAGGAAADAAASMAGDPSSASLTDSSKFDSGVRQR